MIIYYLPAFTRTRIIHRSKKKSNITLEHTKTTESPTVYVSEFLQHFGGLGMLQGYAKQGHVGLPLELTSDSSLPGWILPTLLGFLRLTIAILMATQQARWKKRKTAPCVWLNHPWLRGVYMDNARLAGDQWFFNCVKLYGYILYIYTYIIYIYDNYTCMYAKDPCREYLPTCFS